MRKNKELSLLLNLITEMFIETKSTKKNKSIGYLSIAVDGGEVSLKMLGLKVLILKVLISDMPIIDVAILERLTSRMPRLTKVLLLKMLKRQKLILKRANSRKST